MKGLGTLLTHLQGVGCSPFFFTSALQSAIFGDKARAQQAEILDSNLEFREHLQQIRNEYSRERIDAQIQFRRESYELGRQYLIQQTIAQNESRKKLIEFRNFINNYWPLNESVYAVLDTQTDLLKNRAIVPLNVLIAKTELTSDLRDTYKYKDICEEVRVKLRELMPSATIELCPWKNKCQSRIGEAMNINYIMSGIPTLIIFPYLINDTIGIETAAWSINRGLQSMSHSKFVKIGGVLPEDVSNTTIAALTATIGMYRDAYMISEYHLPAVYNSMVSDEVLAIPELTKLLSTHYSELAELSGSSEFRQLCLPDEIIAIDKSLNNNKLIKA